MSASTTLDDRDVSSALDCVAAARRLLEDRGWVDSFSFSVITLTTVGYGDLSPSTTASKLFTVVYVVGGISLIGAFLDKVMQCRVRRQPNALRS